MLQSSSFCVDFAACSVELFRWPSMCVTLIKVHSITSGAAPLGNTTLHQIDCSHGLPSSVWALLPRLHCILAWLQQSFMAGRHPSPRENVVARNMVCLVNHNGCKQVKAQLLLFPVRLKLALHSGSRTFTASSAIEDPIPDENPVFLAPGISRHL